ncbi:hypothetical protein VCHENC02_4062, partial [Vibrio harveyi]
MVDVRVSEFSIPESSIYLFFYMLTCARYVPKIK